VTRAKTYYIHHGTNMCVRTDLKGKHREYCLCYECARFYPDKANHCEIALAAYGLCKKYNIVTPIWECSRFVEKAEGRIIP